MHPLSVFPSLLTFQLLAPTVLRVAAALYILFVAKMKSKHWSAIIFAVLGVLLFIGLYTQVAALAAIIVLSIDLNRNKKKYGVNLEQKIIFAFVIVILASLLFTGPGFLAFDLPL